MCETLYLVIPCFNEEDVLPESARRLDTKIKSLIERGLVSSRSKILFVNDGSTDKTWDIIKQLHNENKIFLAISLAHNSGEQNAYLAGMMTAKEAADVVITMDADLQDDIDAIDKMVDEYYKGNDIVYGVRASRKNESLFKRFSANTFYRIMKAMGTALIPNHSQYRLMSRRAMDALSGYGEVNLFLPALIPLLGFKNSIVYHERTQRVAGKSKYSVNRLFSLAVQAITSFSLKPIHFVSTAGILFLLVGVGIISVGIVRAITGNVDGWLWVLASVWAVGGVVLIAIGIIGEYVGKTYFETKQRPRYSVSESLLDT